MSGISVIIPCFNRASMVGATIQNMLDQSMPPSEIIVVDDGSTDDTVTVIESFGTNVTLIRQTNQGPGAARNTGLKASSGEYIQFMDSDDLASSNKLQVQFDALTNSGADFAYGPWVRCSINNNDIKFCDRVLQARDIPSSKPMLEWFLSGWSLVFQNCLFKRSILEKAGQYRTDLMPSEDSEYFVRILLAGAVAIHTPECLVYYREHAINKITVSGTTSEQRARDWTRFLTITGELLGDRIGKMRLSTRLALATNVRNHLYYCRRHNLAGLPPSHPYSCIPLPVKSLAINIYSIYEKTLRRVKKSQDFHSAFAVTQPGKHHEMLTKATGYKLISP